MVGAVVDERSARAAAWASAGSAAAIAGLIAGKSTRDALYLSTHALESLPKITAIAAAASLSFAFLVTRLMPRLTPARLAPAILALSVVLSLAEWAIAQSSPETAATVLFLHAGVLGPSSISTFWSLVNERFDPHTAKHVINRIGLGGSAGGVAGGVLAWVAPRFMTPTTMLLALAAFSAMAAVATVQLSRLRLDPHAPAAVPEAAESFAGLRTLAGTAYLRNMATLVVLSAFGAGVLDYLVGAGASGAYTDASDLLAFFATLNLATSVGTLLVQWLAVKPVLAKLGLTWSIAIARIAPIASVALYLVVPGAAGLVALRAPEAMLQSSLYRSGYELLYTPVAEDAKRSTKTIIDVGFDRLGVALAGGAAIVVTGLLASWGTHLLLGLAALAFAASLFVTSRLSRGYVLALESRLKAGLVNVADGDVIDALTKRTLSGSTLNVDRTALLAQIEAIRGKPHAELVPSGAAAAPSDELLDDIASLRSGGVDRARSVLVRRRPFDLVLVGHAIALLARPELRGEARTALRTVAGRVTGQLCDALLDRESPVEVRRGVASVLGGCANERALLGLVGGLADPEARVRDTCAQSLSRITEKDPSLVAPKDAVVEATLRELPRGKVALEHVFTLLSLLVDREPLAIAYSIVSRTAQPALRGTAIEYLDNVLPEGLRAPVLEVLGERAGPRSVRRPHSRVVEELKSSGDVGPVSFRGHVEEPEARD